MKALALKISLTYGFQKPTPVMLYVFIINPVQIGNNMKKLQKVLDVVRQFDLFAPHITVRYKSDNDFKTLTGAILSLALIIFFGVVFVNRFTTMINRTEITSSVLLKQQNDPSFYNTSTSSFMFAVGVICEIMQLTGVDMNTGARYFNWQAQASSVINGTKVKSFMTLQPCTIDMWEPLGSNFVYMYNKLGFSKWLCPAPGQLVEIQGKYSSDVFRYIKIYLTTCTGTVNGQGCKTSAQITTYLSKSQVFGFNFYFVNALINPDEQQPLNIFLDDTNNFPFSIATGTSCNFYIQSYTINTDYSLLPFDEIETVSGGTSPVPAQMTTYAASAGEYMRFYIRKSPVSEIYTRTFFKFDDLLSYIGGLFSLIAMVIQLPLTYYNICCFELSLATELFTYKKKEEKKKKKDKEKEVEMENQKCIKTENSQGMSSPIKMAVSGRVANDNAGSAIELQTIQPKDNSQSQSPMRKPKGQSSAQQQKSKKQKQQQSLSHSIDGFNFFVYIGYIPFFALKRFGWKSLQSKRFTPYYQAIKQVRRQIDLGAIIQRFLYLDRVSKSVLDDDQRRMLHIYPKQNIYQFDEHRTGFKLRDKLKESLVKKDITSLLSIIVPEILGEKMKVPTEQEELKKAYENLVRRHDRISRRIIANLDPDIIQGLIDSQNLQNVSQNPVNQQQSSQASIMPHGLGIPSPSKKDSGDNSSNNFFKPMILKSLKSKRRDGAQSSFNVRTDLTLHQNQVEKGTPMPFEFIDPDEEERK